MTTYVVTGLPRSGTSMMMRALAAGGLDPFVDEDKEAEMRRSWGAKRKAGYDPNPHGVYEPGQYRRRRDFPEMIQGKLVKLMGRNAANRRFARIAPLRVVQMRRDPDAIRESHRKTFGRDPDWAHHHTYVRLIQNHAIRLMSWPHVESVTLVRYEDVVDPATRRAQFERLVLDGWPIDVDSACSTVEESLSRH